jgi:tRNA(Ile)-lysidine synthase TilS/MesJ
MDEKLYRKLQDLVKKECCNYFTDVCIILDKKCPMVYCIRNEEGKLDQKMCKHFKNYVLPANDILYHEYLAETSSDISNSKECSICGKSFVSTDGRQTTCSVCRALDSKMKNLAKKTRKIRQKKL